MDLFILIFGLCLCVLTTCIFLYFRVNKGGVAGVLTKALASLCFILLALFLSASKVGASYYGSYAITLLIAGLVCGLIGDIVLDLKVIYPFHQNKYLAGGMTSFSLGHIFYIAALILFASNEVELFASPHIIPLAIIAGGSLILSFVIWIVSVKVLKLKFEKFTAMVNFYSFILLFTTALSSYLIFVVSSLPMFVLAIGFVLFLLSDLVLSMQYFGGKQDDKKLIVINHSLYYAAQIIIATFIYFV